MKFRNRINHSNRSRQFTEKRRLWLEFEKAQCEERIAKCVYMTKQMELNDKEVLEYLNEELGLSKPIMLTAEEARELGLAHWL